MIFRRKIWGQDILFNFFLDISTFLSLIVVVWFECSCSLNVASKMAGLVCSLIVPLVILLPIIEQMKLGF